MSSTRWLMVVVALGWLACATSTPATAPLPVLEDGSTLRLTVVVNGVRPNGGPVGAALFDNAEAFPQRADALTTTWIAAEGERVTWVVDELVPGTYAAAVFQDLDGDLELGRVGLGPPSEPYAFSNDARGTFGPPKFQQAAVRLEAGDAEIVITLR